MAKLVVDEVEGIVTNIVSRALDELLEVFQVPTKHNYADDRYHKLEKRFFELECQFSKLSDQFAPLPNESR